MYSPVTHYVSSPDHKGPGARRPDDWKNIFSQNVDDDFKVGLQTNPGQGKGNGDDKGSFVRLYSGGFVVLVVSVICSISANSSAHSLTQILLTR